MQSVYFSAGKTSCRFCGEIVRVNQLSLHIVTTHPRPVPTDTTPALVRKRIPRRAVPATSVK